MHARTIDQTLRMPEIGFGCGGNAGLMVRGTPQDQREAVEAALACGITLFDTAPVYGDGASERNLGSALRALGARPRIATKVVLELSDLDDIAGAVVRSLETSLERLQLDDVDVLYLHNRVAAQRAPRGELGVGALLTVDDVLGPGGVLEGFRALRVRGLARATGCCAFGGEMSAVRALLDAGAFDALLVQSSVLNESAWRRSPGVDHDFDRIGAYAAERGVATCALRIFEGGALTGTRHALARNDAATPAYRRTVARAAALDALTGGDPVRFALRFALANPQLASVLVGFSDAAQVREVAAFAADGPLDGALVAEARRRVDAATSARSARP